MEIFDQNVAEPRIAVILPESGDKRWDALIKGMKQAAAENNVHMIICNTEEINGPEDGKRIYQGTEGQRY